MLWAPVAELKRRYEVRSGRVSFLRQLPGGQRMDAEDWTPPLVPFLLLKQKEDSSLLQFSLLPAVSLIRGDFLLGLGWGWGWSGCMFDMC